MGRNRGKLLKVKFGVNPNSSSIGSDMIWLMFGTWAVVMVTFGLTGFIRMFKRRNVSIDK